MTLETHVSCIKTPCAHPVGVSMN